jgi:hypothetical protein
VEGGEKQEGGRERREDRRGRWRENGKREEDSIGEGGGERKVNRRGKR